LGIMRNSTPFPMLCWVLRPEIIVGVNQDTIYCAALRAHEGAKARLAALRRNIGRHLHPPAALFAGRVWITPPFFSHIHKSWCRGENPFPPNSTSCLVSIVLTYLVGRIWKGLLDLAVACFPLRRTCREDVTAITFWRFAHLRAKRPARSVHSRQWSVVHLLGHTGDGGFVRNPTTLLGASPPPSPTFENRIPAPSQPPVINGPLARSPYGGVL
jgi:hypothetical protein